MENLVTMSMLYESVRLKNKQKKRIVYVRAVYDYIGRFDFSRGA